MFSSFHRARMTTVHVFQLYDALTADHRRAFIDPMIDNHVYRVHPLDPAVLKHHIHGGLQLTCACCFRLYWTAGHTYARFLARLCTGYSCVCGNQICHDCWLTQYRAAAAAATTYMRPILRCAWCSTETCARELRFFAARRVDN